MIVYLHPKAQPYFLLAALPGEPSPHGSQPLEAARTPWLPAHPFVLKATWAAKSFLGQSPLTLTLLSLSWPHENPAVALGTWITQGIHVDPGAPSSPALHP